MSTQIKRRMLLRGLGGAVVAAPFLSSIWRRAAKGQAAATPKQLIVMFTHYGCITTKWFPQKSHGALTCSDITNSIAPLDHPTRADARRAAGDVERTPYRPSWRLRRGWRCGRARDRLAVDPGPSVGKRAATAAIGLGSLIAGRLIKRHFRS